MVFYAPFGKVNRIDESRGHLAGLSECLTPPCPIIISVRSEMPAARRFPPPWSVEDNGAYFSSGSLESSGLIERTVVAPQNTQL